MVSTAIGHPYLKTRKQEIRSRVGEIDRSHDLACPDCYGRGTGPTGHDGLPTKCRTCNGLGIVCPTCKAAHFVRTGNIHDGIRPCPHCTVEVGEHRRYSEEREVQALERWLDQNEFHDVPF